MTSVAGTIARLKVACGRPRGYGDFLEAIEGHRHERYEQLGE